MPDSRGYSLSQDHSTICVLLADDHPIVRFGVQCILERDPAIRVIGVADDGATAVGEVERIRPQVVVIDMALPGTSGIEATRSITSRMPEIGVLVLSQHSSPAIARRALDAGARGYLDKAASPEELVQGVRTVACGKHYIGQTVAHNVLEMETLAWTSDKSPRVLTSTQWNIVKLVATGKSNREIALSIGLSPRTVETYRMRLMRKLGIENLPSLVRYAIRYGIIPLE
jgi:DNA-binding NarL/FixJ family response regulator